MKRMFEFCCEDFHVTEAYVDDSIRVRACPICSQDAKRIISTPMFKLEGITGQFPTAYDAWERKRAEKLAVERKQNGTEDFA
jgi:hypothetical protein